MKLSVKPKGGLAETRTGHPGNLLGIYLYKEPTFQNELWVRKAMKGRRNLSEAGQN